MDCCQENNQDTMPNSTDPSEREAIATSLRNLLDSNGASLPDAIGEKQKKK